MLRANKFWTAVQAHSVNQGLSGPVWLVAGEREHRTTPGESIRLKLNGRLAALIGAPTFPEGFVLVKMVAGEGLEPPTPGL